MIDAEKILKEEQMYFAKEIICNIPCHIGYVKRFRWRWMATQLNTFVFIAEVNGTMTQLMMRSFAKACYDYAIHNNKGWPRGLQSGVGAIAILVGDEITQDGAAYCMADPNAHFSAFEVPVAYLKKYKQPVHFRGTQIWGAIYYPYFSEIIRRICGKLAANQPPESMPPPLPSADQGQQ
ncbi:hypothetical protein ACR79M_21285 [Sphingobacterium spiritivorum]|uniref:hypothetical protein n=1 Tax=Sphingobacterium spiritivorum TaxID=258 RepID=UPI003DA20AE2